MIIRKAILKDAPAVMELWKEFMKYHDELIIKKDKRFIPQFVKKKESPELFRKFVEKNIRSKNGEIYVVEVDDKLVGYSLIYIKDNIPVFEIEKLGCISDLYVKKEYRMKGISSKLKDETIKWFKKKGIKDLCLTIYPLNEHAYSIYKKWGFFDFHLEMRKRL